MQHVGIADWHFSRKQIAESYLRTLSSGVMLSTTIYAPPKTGLSQFLINDVILCARDDKYVTVYIDFSDPKVPVTAAVLAGLERVLSGSSIFQSSFNFLRGLFQSRMPYEARVKTSEFKRNLEIIDEDFFIQNKVMHLALIDSYFKKIFEYKSVIVIVDHADELNKDDLGKEFCLYFRSLISQNSNVVRPLYGTNNLSAWSGVFDNRSSALYSEGAFVHKLPILGKVFVREVINRLGLDISMEESYKCFELVGGKPGVFMRLIMAWKTNYSVSLFDYFSIEVEVPKKNKNNAVPNKILFE